MAQSKFVTKYNAGAYLLPAGHKALAPWLTWFRSGNVARFNRLGRRRFCKLLEPLAEGSFVLVAFKLAGCFLKLLDLRFL